MPRANRRWELGEPPIRSVALAGRSLFYEAGGVIYRATDPPVEWSRC